MLKKFILNFFIINFFSIFDVGAFTFAQITDIHLSDQLTEPNLERLDRALDHIKTITKPEMLLVTGDFTKKGPKINHTEAYKILKKRLDALSIPYYVIPGNHDFLEPFHHVFDASEHLRNKPFYGHALSYKNVLFYGLDALHQMKESPKGLIDFDQLDWLKKSLAYNTMGRKYKKIIVFVHQPPITQNNFPVFIKSPFEKLYDYCFDAESVHNLFTILNHYPEANTILTGHLHMGAIFKMPMDKYIYACPSIAPTKQMYLDKAFMLSLMGVYVDQDPGYSFYTYDEEKDVLLTRYYFIDAQKKARKVKPSAITAIDFAEAEKKYQKKPN